MKMSEIQRGECFSFSGLRWLAIEPTDRGTYALLDSVPELLKRRPFANLSTRRGKDPVSYTHLTLPTNSRE